MPAHDAIRPVVGGRDTSRRIRDAWPLVLPLVFALATLGFAVTLAYGQLFTPQRPLQTLSAILLFLAGLAQLQQARQFVALRQKAWVLIVRQRGFLWRWYIVAMGASLATALALGPGWGAVYLLIAFGTVAHTLGIAWVLLGASTQGPTAKLSGGAFSLFWQSRWLASRSADRAQRWLNRMLSCAALVVVLLLGSEATLRVAAVVTDDQASKLRRIERAKADFWQSNAMQGMPVTNVNQHGYCNDAFQPMTNSRGLRVAALGSAWGASRYEPGHCLSLIEQQLSSVEVYNFALPQLGPHEFAAQVEHDVADYQPHLVLAFVCVGQDLAPRLIETQPLDWRRWQLARRGARWLGITLHGSPVRQEQSENLDPWMSYCASELEMCRTPNNERMAREWLNLEGDLRRLAQACRQRQMDLALVVVPAQWQVSARWRWLLCHRNGLDPLQVDVELPQRRLARWSLEQNIPLVDLLPYFRKAERPLFAQQSHALSEAGHAVVGEVLSSWIERRGVVTVAMRP